MYGSINGGATPRKKERRVTLLFRHSDADQHCAGVEGLAVSQDNTELFSASRDSTVRRWDLSSGKPVCAASYEGHIDWANDIALVNDLLVTCSSDRTVKVWKADRGPCIHTFQHHSDYVTCLAASASRNVVVSAGLRSEVLWYDLQTSQASLLHAFNNTSSSSSSMPVADGSSAGMGPGGGSGGVAPSHHTKWHSIYAVDMERNGLFVAVGTTEGSIRIIDPRTQQKVLKLTGHTDNIRALLLSRDGHFLLSGSSDHTVKLWDLGQQRCVQTLAMHSESVWSLAANESLTQVYSGSRDGCVYSSNLQQRSTKLLLKEEQPIRAMVLTPDASRLWVSTTSPSIHGYDLNPTGIPRDSTSGGGGGPRDPTTAAAAAGGSLGGVGSGSFSRGTPGSSSRAFIGSSPAVRFRRHSVDPQGSEVAPTCSTPAVTIPGVPGLTHHRILPDRRHILTKDSRGNVLLWSVLHGAPVEQYGQVDLAAKESELWVPMDVPAWFSADTKLGLLAVHLDPPRCFAAEAYARDMGMLDQPDDQKLNLGACLLRNSFRHWALAFSRRYMSAAPLPLLDGVMGDMPTFSDTLPPAVISQTSTGVHWRTLTTSFSGQEREDEEIPPWVCDALLKAEYPYVRELKCAFVLQPKEGSNLPSLLQSRLNAPRILQVKKVANYAVNKLVEQGVDVQSWEVGWNPASQMPPAAELHNNFLELECNGMAVPYDMSISSVKRFLWKRSDDVMFLYKIMDPANLAPFPRLTQDAL